MEVYPLVMSNIAIEAMAIEIVSFPINSMVIFHSYHSYVAVYQRVHTMWGPQTYKLIYNPM